MSDRELSALTTLGFDELARATGGIGQVQRAVSGRVFRMVGPGAVLVRPLHEGITRGVYRGLGAGTKAVGMAAGGIAGRREGRLVSSTPGGAALIGAITGLTGDRLEEEHSPLAQPMAVRVAGEPVALEPEAVATAFPDATRRIVVFIHGLMTTEFSWALGGRERFGDRLAREIGCTPVYVRYNTGRHISENGRSLCELIDQLLAAWPVDVDEVALVGHSMGGLVARSACCHAAEADADWARLVKQSVSLGTPHMGAPLEQAVHVLSAGLARLPETRPSRTSCVAAAAASATCAGDRWWTRTGATRIRTRCAEPPVPRFRCSKARLTASCRPRSPAANATPSRG